PAPLGVSQEDPLPGTASGGAASGGAGFEGDGPGGAEPGGAESGGAESGGAESGGAEPGVLSMWVWSLGVLSLRVWSLGVLCRRVRSLGPPSPQQLREWFAQCTHLRSGVVRTRDSAARDTGAGGAGDIGRVGGTTGAAAAGPGGARTGGAGAVGAGAGGTSAGGAEAGGAGAVDPGSGGVGGIVQPRPYFAPLLQQVLGVPSSPDLSHPALQPTSPLPTPSPYTEHTGGLKERREPASCLASPVRTGRCIPRLRPPPVPGTHAMALRPSFEPLRVPLPPPPASSLPAVPDP
ncbi:unnamed protein product, partial [Closterium sp. NIES-54]